MRIARHRALVAALAAMTDDELCAVVDAAESHASIGGSTTVMTVDGIPVFVKRLALTDLERAHEGSTANLFELPLFYQYGVGSSGFGAWRELAALRQTTAWVLEAACESFPLLHHARVVAGSPGRVRGLELLVAQWGGAAAVRARLEALDRATASIVLVLEHIPQTVEDWLAGGGELAMVERDLMAGVGFMAAHGLLHFDGHFRNLLTDGTRLYFADFGLALASWFELTAEEAAFFEEHRAHDRAYAAMTLVNWVTAHAPDRRDILERHGPAAAIMNAFYADLVRERRPVRFPAALR